MKKKPVTKTKRAAWVVGNAYFIRTVPHYYTGRLVAIHDKELVLTDAAWIADTGRFSTALTTGVFSEVEPFPRPITINRAALSDATEWPHPLPRDQK
jgi:hypothetical protein